MCTHYTIERWEEHLLQFSADIVESTSLTGTGLLELTERVKELVGEIEKNTRFLGAV